MSDDLDRQIEEAARAAAELRRLEELRDALPALQAERERRQRQDRASAELDAATANARRLLEEYRAGVGDFRTEFELWVSDGKMLADKLRRLVEGIPGAALVLTGAIVNAQRNELPAANPAATWQQIGWCDVDPALPNRNDGRVFRVADFDEKAGKLLAELAGVRVYEPNVGIRSAGVQA